MTTSSVPQTDALPVRAALLAAARAARRVQHRYLPGGDEASQRATLQAIADALELAERFAAGDNVSDAEIERLEEAVIAACQTAMEGEDGDQSSAFVASAVYAIVDATRAALRMGESEGNEAADQFLSCLSVAADATLAADPSLETLIQSERQHLAEQQLGVFPELGAPVSDLVFESFTPRTGHELLRELERSHIAEPIVEHSVDSDRDLTEQAQRIAERLRKRKQVLDEQFEGLQAERAALEAERSAVDEQISSMEEQAAELQQIHSDLKTLRSELEEARQELERERRELEAERAACVAEGAAQEAVREELARREQLLQSREASLQSREESLHGAEEKVRADRNAAAKALREARAAKKELAAQRAALERQQQALAAQASKTNERAEERRTRHDRLLPKALRLRQLRRQLAERLGELESREKEHEAAAQKTAEDQKRWLRDREAELENAKGELHRRSQELEREKISLQSEAARLASERAALEELRERLEEHKAEIARREQELKAEFQLRSQSAEVAEPAESGLEMPGGTEPMRADVAERLQQITAVLQRERQQLRAERMRLNDEFARLGIRAAVLAVEGASRGGSEENEVAASRDEQIRPLRLIVNVGSTGSLRLAELLSELSKLFRQVGGPGVRFEVHGAREWRPMDGEPGYSGREASQHLVDLSAIPAAPPGEPTLPVDPSVWNRFRSCLLLVFRSDARLANFYELAGSESAREEMAHRVTEAARRAYHAYAAQREPVLAGPHQLALETLQRQQDRVAELFENLRNEFDFEMEIAPPAASEAPEPKPAADPQPIAADQTPAGRWAGWLRRRRVLVSGAILGLLVGGMILVTWLW